VAAKNLNAESRWARIRRGFLPQPAMGLLFAGGRELRTDVREGCLQLAAEGVDDRDDRNGDSGSDQTVFNGGGAGFVLDKARNDVLSFDTPEM
jgi:hypothetical protein